MLMLYLYVNSILLDKTVIPTQLKEILEDTDNAWCSFEKGKIWKSFCDPWHTVAPGPWVKKDIESDICHLIKSLRTD